MKVKVWDDWKSYAHTVMGFIVCFNPIWFGVGALLYLLYELIESKQLSELVGDILEFCFGAFIWHAAFCIWSLLNLLG